MVKTHASDRPPFDSGTVDTVCHVIGDLYTSSVLTQVLADAHLKEQDAGLGGTKWKRLYAAVAFRQDTDQDGKALLALVTAAMNPTRLLARAQSPDGSDSGAWARDRLNQALSLAGLKVDGEGKLRVMARATTVDEALQRGERLRTQLTDRGHHTEILAHCPGSLARDGYYEVVFESIKGLGARLRSMSGKGLDGHRLVDATLGGTSPIIRLNALATDAERSEQVGVANLAKGVFSAFRNPAAHETRLDWSIDEHDALDVLGTVSLIHRRLDTATVSTWSRSCQLTPRSE